MLTGVHLNVDAARTRLNADLDTTQPLVIPNTIAPGRSGYVLTCEPHGLVALRLEDGKATIPVTGAAEPSRC